MNKVNLRLWSAILSTQVMLRLPKVNLLSITGGILALLSITLAWWGIVGPGETISVTLVNVNGLFPDGVAQSLSILFVLALALVILSAVVGLFGSFYEQNILLFGGTMLSALSAIVYGIALSTGLQYDCNISGASICPSGLIGSAPQYAVSWGFQIGFYVFITSGVLFSVGAMFHRYFFQSATLGRTIAGQGSLVGTARKGKYCSECGSPILAGAKFCSECANPLQLKAP